MALKLMKAYARAATIALAYDIGVSVAAATRCAVKTTSECHRAGDNKQ
jgi:hypothetical protein